MISQGTILQIRNLVEILKNSMQTHFVRFMTGEVSNFLPTIYDLASLNSNICSAIISLLREDLPNLQFESSFQVLTLGLLLSDLAVTDNGCYTLSTDVLADRRYLVQSDELLKSWTPEKGIIVENNRVVGIKPIRLDRLDVRYIKAVKQKKFLGKVNVCLPSSLYYKLLVILQTWLQQSVGEAVISEGNKTSTYTVTLSKVAIENRFSGSVTSELRKNLVDKMSKEAFMSPRMLVVNLGRKAVIPLNLFNLVKLVKVEGYDKGTDTSRAFAQALPKLRGLLNTMLEYVANEIYSFNVHDISLSETDYLKSYAYCLFLTSIGAGRDAVVQRGGYSLNMNVKYLNDADGKLTLTAKGRDNQAVVDLWRLGSCIRSGNFEFKASPSTPMFTQNRDKGSITLTGTLDLSKHTDKQLFALYTLVLKAVFSSLYSDSVLVHIPSKLISLAKSEFIGLHNFSVLEGVNEFYLKIKID